jgi:type VI protein secretion system component Hcp
MRSKITWWTLAVVMLAAVSFAPSPAHAQIQGFMKFPPLIGDSTVEGHVGEIELLSYTQTAGAAACFKVAVVKNLDSSSPALAAFAISNQVFAQVTIMLTRITQGAVVPVFTALLSNVVVGTVELVEVDGGPTPTERVTLKPQRIELSFNAQNPDGTTFAVTKKFTCP